MRYMTETARHQMGARIRQARQESGLSHDRLGAVVGTSRQHLIKLEKGLHAPSENMLGRIAVATNRDVEWFTDGDDGSSDGESSSPTMFEDLFRKMVQEAVRSEIEAAHRKQAREIERAAERRSVA